MSFNLGCCVAITTPFNEDKTINYIALENHINFLIKNNVDSIIPCGTTGESSTLSIDEKLEIIKFTLEIVNNRVPVIAGTGCNDTNKTIELSNKCEKLGVDGLLLITPYYNKPTQKGLIKHYKLIEKNTKSKIVLYNVPNRTGVNMDVNTVYELSQIKNIIAIKEASGDISKIMEIASLCKDNIDIYSGNDDQIFPILAIGGKGVISVVANIIPKDTKKIIDSFIEGDIEESRKMQFNMLNLIKALFLESNPIPVKEALNLMGFDIGGYRYPLCEMDPHNKEILVKELKNYNLI